jgi:hypothetical protein
VNDSGAKLVLLKIAESANDLGLAWPSQRHIAEHCEMGDRNVRLKIQKLTELGLLTITRRQRTDGTRENNLYQLASGTPLPMEPAEITTGSTLPKNQVPVEPSEPSIETIGSPLPLDQCPQCGIKPRGKSVAEHLEDVHGVRAA